MKFISKVILIAIVAISFAPSAFALNCTLDEKPQVLFGNSSPFMGYLGFENYDYEYVNGWLHITGTIAQNPCCYASYPVQWRIMDKDCSIEYATARASGTAWYQAGYTGNTDWFTVDLQFSATGVASQMYFRTNSYSPINADFPKFTAVSGVETTDFVYIYNNYPPANVYSMTFTPVKIFMPPNSAVTMSSPPSGSTITSVDGTNISGRWDILHPEWYHDIEFSFSSGAIGESTETFFIVNPNASGEFTIPLSEFSLPSNGTWYFRATLTYKSIQLSDMLVTENIVYPEEYNIKLDIPGLPTAYQFTDFPEWYETNAAGGYEYPSDFASSITDFFIPIFERAGEFTN
ncbi:MAG TPA: hypothetical protein PKZ12_02880, partial [Smithellaceae bacterium]|nr:hypothetical protein [Smithellaceae bacterium]